MKRSLIVATCVLLAPFFLSSCQKESKSALDLARDLTAELQQITDLATADAHAARVEVLNKRFQNASVRVLALNETALCRSADDGDHEGESYAEALKALAKEIGRVRASYPSTTHDGQVDTDQLLLAIGSANGGETAARRKEIGLSFVQDQTGAHELPGTFPEFYGSIKLQDALAYRANVATTSSFEDTEVPALPEVSAVETPAENESAETADSDSADDTADKDDTPAPAAADDTPSSSSDDDSSSVGDDDDEEEEEDDDE